MKVYPVLSILVATALTIVVDAAPTPAHAPRTGIHTDAKAFLLPKYDHKLAEEMNAYYDQAIYGNRTVARSNAVARAASQSVEILPYCAGIAADDKGSTRVQIFKNEMTCDINGWSSLFTFTAYTKKDTHHATYPMCVAIGKSPAYSMFFSNKSPCSSGEWKTEFAFYESGSMTNDPTVSLVHESSVMWHVGVPPQDDALPLLRGKQVWMDLHPEVPLPLFPASSAEMKSLKGWVSYHEPAHADLKVVATPNTMTFRCVQNLIQIWHGIPHGLAASPSLGESLSSKIMVGNKVHAAMLLSIGQWMANADVSSNIRNALQENLRTVKPVAAGNYDVPRNSIIAKIASDYVVIGQAETYRALWVSTILSALAATALSIAVHAVPSTATANNNSTMPHTNLAIRAAAPSKSPVEILPYCVGVATDDKGNTRNKMQCDISGWDTLFVFTAHTKYDKHMAPYPMCVAKGGGPNRSMLFSGKTSCTSGEWKTDFVFYESGSRGGDKAASPYHQSTVMWQKYGPHRMMLYPFYDGVRWGWIEAYSLQYRTRFRRWDGADQYYDQLKDQFEVVERSVPVVFPANVATYRCALNLIQILEQKMIPVSGTLEVSSPGKNFPQYVADAARDECKNLVNSSTIRFNRIISPKRRVATIEVLIANKVHAAILLSYDIWNEYRGMDAEFRMALEESLRTGRVVPIHPSSKWYGLVAQVQGQRVTMGKTWQQQRAWLTTTPPHLRQYEKHHDHINLKKPTSSSPVTGTTSVAGAEAHLRGTPASVVDQGLDDPLVQQAIDTHLDLNPDAQLKLQHSTRDTDTTLLAEQDVVTSSTTNTSVLLEDKQRSEEEFSWFVDKTYTATVTEEDKVSSQDFVPLWKRNSRGHHHNQKHPKQLHHPSATKPTDKDDDLQNAPVAIRGLVRMLEHERARNVTVMDMRQKCDWTDWMVIAEGLSERHVGNVADEVYSALKKMLPKASPPLMEGRSTPDWVVIDTGSIILHFMTHETRKERNLEGLWGAVKDPLKLKNAEEITWEDVQAKLTESWNAEDAASTSGKSKKGGAHAAGHGTRRSRRGDEDLSLEEVVKG
ncbi:hypothetical protein BGW39_006615 [Mortierella sp. 14UC]|nr:hypothetical protein BGW39_006615 [Mortierella sp. 14UC]